MTGRVLILGVTAFVAFGGTALACTFRAHEAERLFLRDELDPETRARATAYFIRGLRACAEGASDQADALFAAARDSLRKIAIETAEPPELVSEGEAPEPPPR